MIVRKQPVSIAGGTSSRRSRSAFVLPHSFLTSSSVAHASSALLASRRYQANSAYTKDQRRNMPGADPNTANQTQLVEGPDMTYHMRFSSNTLAHVGVPEVTEDVRNRSDLEKDREMKRKFGDLGPGDTPKKNAAGVRRDMLEAQQDIDGLPWEVRWRKNLIPTHEEVIQDIRDRFDLYIQDPMEREVEWYLHWKDRGFRVQKDRLIWPQGFTDYLDHYDEFGRRRVLPSDQKWSDSSWKYLADAKYRDRMWLIEGEERKAVHLQLAPQEQLIAEEEKRLSDIGDVLQGLSAGVLDLDEDQMYQALSGTADPIEVAKTKAKIVSYGATEALRVASGEEIPPEQLDPISGFPKSSLEPLPTGITVEQGAKIAMMGGVQREYVEQAGLSAQSKGLDPLVAVLKAQHHLAKKAGDQPGISTLVEGKVEHVKQLVEDRKRLGDKPLSEGSLLATVATLEGNIKQSEGFINVTPRPAGEEPDIAPELYTSPKTDISMGKVSDAEMPEWYRQQLIDTQPLIRTYNLVGDPIETTAADPKYLAKGGGGAADGAPSPAKRASLLDDNASLGESAFDEVKLHKLRNMPELTSEFEPLPTFKEVSKQERAKNAAKLSGDEKPMKKSEKLRQERLERQRKAKNEMDTDILLPTLPWESDSIPDPYRGVANHSASADDDNVAMVDVPKKDLEATWMAYRNFFRQTLTEFGNLSRTVTEDRCVQMLLDSVQKIRRDEVGDHPQIPKEHLEVVQLVFEGHVKQFISDFFKSANIRTSEVQVYKSEADDILRKASAKSKLLGKNFMNFVQEMTSLELDSVRKNPVQKHAIMLRDKKMEPLAKPFGRWIESQLKEFIVTEYAAPEQIDQYKEALLKSLKDTRFKCPMRIEGVKDGARDATVEALFQWCAGTLHYYAAKHMFRLFLEHGETRFRGRSEDYSETANEYFGCAFQASSGNITLPLPETDPFWEYSDRDFLDGESAATAELIGNLDKAESIWHSGSQKVWYPLLDETEFMWYCERRGRYNTAIDVSDRCLENLNKRTHPSIHPFPERARVFLEGAPLTQETAEHLWMQYMGDVYIRHSDFMQRMGRFATARNYREKALNLYHLAIRTANERLPQSWTAPLLTRAKYLCQVAGFGDLSPEEHMEQVDALMERMYALNPPPRHWVELDGDIPYRIAVFAKAIPVMGQLISNAAASKVKMPDETALQNFAQNRARGGAYTEKEWFHATNEAAEEILRKRVLKWRSREVEGSDPWLFWTHLYFTFRVQPESVEKVQEYWDLYEPVFLHIYTQAAMCSRPRGVRLLADALRRIIQILVPGNADHHKILMKELVGVREKLAHLVNTRELDRSINTLETFMIDPKKVVPYVYGTEALQREMVWMNKMRNNPSLKIDFAAKDYQELLERSAKVKAGSGHYSTNDAYQQSTQTAGDQEHNAASMTATSSSEVQTSTRKMF